MEKNKMLYRLILFSVLGICIAAAVVIFAATRSQEHPIRIPEPVEEISPVGYVVRLEGNIVNVYTRGSEGETYSKSLSEVNIFDLPEQTTENLRRGIEIEDRAGLARLVEEISS